MAVCVSLDFSVMCLLREGSRLSFLLFTLSGFQMPHCTHRHTFDCNPHDRLTLSDSWPGVHTKFTQKTLWATKKKKHPCSTTFFSVNFWHLFRVQTPVEIILSMTEYSKWRRRQLLNWSTDSWYVESMAGYQRHDGQTVAGGGAPCTN